MSTAFPTRTVSARSVKVEKYYWQFIRNPGKYLVDSLGCDILVDDIEKCVKW